MHISCGATSRGTIVVPETGSVSKRSIKPSWSVSWARVGTWASLPSGKPWKCSGSQLAAIAFHQKIDISDTCHFNENKFLVVLRLYKAHRRPGVVDYPGMELVAEKFVILIFSAALGVLHGIGIFCAKPDRDEFNVLRIHHAARIVRRGVLDTVDVVLPLPIHLNAVSFCNLPDDVSLHYLGAVQTQASVIHCQENRVCFVVRRCVDLQKEDLLYQPVNKVRKRFSLQLVREDVLYVLIPVKHIL